MQLKRVSDVSTILMTPHFHLAHKNLTPTLKASHVFLLQVAIPLV